MRCRAKRKKKLILNHRRIQVRLESRKKGVRKISVVKHEKTGKPRKNKEKQKPKKPEEMTIVYRKPASGITTEIDDMLQMVSERKKVKVDQIAKSLKVSEDRIQEWAKILEERGLVRIHYPAIGKTEIRIGVEKGK